MIVVFLMGLSIIFSYMYETPFFHYKKKNVKGLVTSLTKISKINNDPETHSKITNEIHK